MTRHVGNLQAEVTSFVGRRRELATAKRLLSVTRLLTLVGAGGVGKTRLARQVAARVHRAFADGVWLVELASVRHGDLVARAVSGVLGLRDESPDPAARLADYLRDRQLLLVVDNCEHVLDAGARLISELLAAAPDVRVLATSRQVLGVGGEQLLPVPPLSVPATDEPASVGQSEAVALFADRASAAVPEFAVTAQNRHQVSALCRRLDGIPLALELAAVRLRAIPLPRIVERVDDALRFLAQGDRTAPARQQTLQAAVGWSYDLCSAAEQRLWQQLSVFAGGFALDAVDAVCGADSLGLLAELVDKSVVNRPPAKPPDADRYTMLAVLRQYGGARGAASGGEREVRLRHAEYFGKLAGRGMADYVSPRDAAWFGAVGRELPNLRGALAFALTEPDAVRTALDTASGLRPYWAHTGYLREGFRWLGRALALDPAPTLARARALSAAAHLAVLLGEVEPAERLAAEGRSILNRLDAPAVAADLAVAAALLAYLRGDLPGTLKLADETIRSCRPVDAPASLSEALFVAASVSFELEDPRAPELSARFLAATEGAGAHLLTACAHWISGLAALRAGDQQAARDHLRAAITLFGRFDHPNLTAMGLEALSCVAVADHDHERAARLMGAAHRIWQTSHMPMASQVSRRTTEKALALARDALGAESFGTAFERGAELAYDQVLGYALGRATPAGEPSARAAPVVLTRREQQIAELVAAGLSNKDIAAELVISRRTAESHVEHILDKLGFGSRAQIAAWVGQRHAPPWVYP